MALLTATQPTAAGVNWTPAAVSASDTIPASALGARGAYLIIFNAGAGADSVVVVDSSLTPAGNISANLTNSVSNSQPEVMFIPAATVNPATGLTTVTHTQPSGVTYVLLPVA